MGMFFVATVYGVCKKNHCLSKLRVAWTFGIQCCVQQTKRRIKTSCIIDKIDIPSPVSDKLDGQTGGNDTGSLRFPQEDITYFNHVLRYRLQTIQLNAWLKKSVLGIDSVLSHNVTVPIGLTCNFAISNNSGCCSEDYIMKSSQISRNLTSNWNTLIKTNCFVV